MSHYRKIDIRIWNDEKFNDLSHMGKLAFIFFLTHPNLTPVGAMRATVIGLADELESLPEAFDEAIAKGMLRVDKKAKILCAPNFLKYNKPESPNVIKAWAKAFEYIPECELKNELYQYILDLREGLPEGFYKVFDDVFPKTSANQ